MDMWFYVIIGACCPVVVFVVLAIIAGAIHEPQDTPMLKKILPRLQGEISGDTWECEFDGVKIKRDSWSWISVLCLDGRDIAEMLTPDEKSRITRHLDRKIAERNFRKKKAWDLKIQKERQEFLNQ